MNGLGSLKRLVVYMSDESRYRYLVRPRGVKFPTRHEAVGYSAVSERMDPAPVELEVVAVEVDEDGEILSRDEPV